MNPQATGTSGDQTTGVPGSFSTPYQMLAFNPFLAPYHQRPSQVSAFNTYSNPSDAFDEIVTGHHNNTDIPQNPVQNTFTARAAPMAPPGPAGWSRPDGSGPLPPIGSNTRPPLGPPGPRGWSRPDGGGPLTPIASRSGGSSFLHRYTPEVLGVPQPNSGYANANRGPSNLLEELDAEAAVSLPSYESPYLYHGVNDFDPVIEHASIASVATSFDDGLNVNGVATSNPVYEPVQAADNYDTPLPTHTNTAHHVNHPTHNNDHPGGSIGPGGMSSQQLLAAVTTPPAPNGQANPATSAGANGFAGQNSTVPFDGSWTLALAQQMAAQHPLPTLQDIAPAADIPVRTAGTGPMNPKNPGNGIYWGGKKGHVKAVAVFS